MSSHRFFVRKNNKNYATPFFIALLFIELSDVIFAVDSVPAVLSVSNDVFIVYTSNIFAILGLRSLYFALSEFANISLSELCFGGHSYFYWG
jgi:tellurite resistance protein TerC